MSRKLSEQILPGIIETILILILVSGLFSCWFQRGSIVLMTRDYWWEAYGEQGNLDIELRKIAGSENMKFYLRVLSREDDVSALLDQFKGKKDTTIVLDPVLSYRLLRSDRKATGESILITGGNGERSLIVSLSMDETLELAGKITSDIFKIDGFSRCVVFYPRGGTGGGVMVSAFRRGFESGVVEGNGEILAEARVSDLMNKTKARRLYERYSSNGKSIYVLMTYSLTPFFLDLIENGEGYAVIMDSPDGIAEDRVIFSVGYDYRRAVGRGVRRFLEKTGSAEGKDFHMKERAYIRWGKVIALPEKYSKEELIVR